nr:unnamed protein product [Digitaria exilis]
MPHADKRVNRDRVGFTASQPCEAGRDKYTGIKAMPTKGGPYSSRTLSLLFLPRRLHPLPSTVTAPQLQVVAPPLREPWSPLRRLAPSTDCSSTHWSDFVHCRSSGDLESGPDELESGSGELKSGPSGLDSRRGSSSAQLLEPTAPPLQLLDALVELRTLVRGPGTLPELDAVHPSEGIGTGMGKKGKRRERMVDEIRELLKPKSWERSRIEVDECKAEVPERGKVEERRIQPRAHQVQPTEVKRNDSAGGHVAGDALPVAAITNQCQIAMMLLAGGGKKLDLGGKNRHCHGVNLVNRDLTSDLLDSLEPLLWGDNFGLVDIALVPFTCWFLAYEKLAKIIVWAKLYKECESVTKVLPDSYKVFEFIQFLHSKFGEERRLNVFAEVDAITTT